MRQRHRPVDEKRVVVALFAIDEVGYVFEKQIVAVLVVRILPVASVLVNHRILVTRPLVLGVMSMPHAELVETRVLDPLTLIPPLRTFVRRVIGIQLPLARDAGVVPGFREDMPERNLIRAHQPKREIVPEIVLARHQRNPRRRAQRQDMTLVKPHPIRRHLIQPRRRVRRSAVYSDGLVTEVVGHDHDDIRSLTWHCCTSRSALRHQLREHRLQFRPRRCLIRVVV